LTGYDAFIRAFEGGHEEAFQSRQQTSRTATPQDANAKAPQCA
jgi:hypothetical protein